MTQKSKLGKTRREVGIKGSRFNAECECGWPLRLRMDPRETHVLFGQRTAGKNLIAGATKAPQATIAVNPARCPDCNFFVLKITIQPNNQWLATEVLSQQKLKHEIHKRRLRMAERSWRM